MKKVINSPWVFYLDGNPEFDDHKVGKWMYFFNDRKRVAGLCEKAIEEGIVLEAKHSDAEEGVACFYLEFNDMKTHKKVIQFFLDNDMIQKTKSGKLHNISFKLDDQTRAGEYGNEFVSVIKLEHFLNLITGEWIV